MPQLMAFCVRRVRHNSVQLLRTYINANNFWQKLHEDESDLREGCRSLNSWAPGTH